MLSTDIPNMAEYTPSDFGLRLLQTIVLRDVLFWRVELDHVAVVDAPGGARRSRIIWECELLDGAELVVLEGLLAVLLEQDGIDKLT